MHVRRRCAVGKEQPWPRPWLVLLVLMLVARSPEGKKPLTPEAGAVASELQAAVQDLRDKKIDSSLRRFSRLAEVLERDEDGISQELQQFAFDIYYGHASCLHAAGHTLNENPVEQTRLFQQTVKQFSLAQRHGLGHPAVTDNLGFEINMARLAVRIGDLEAGGRHFEAAAAVAPDDPVVLYDVARFFKYSGNVSASKRTFSRALRSLKRREFPPDSVHSGLQRPFLLWNLVLHEYGELLREASGEPAAASRIFAEGVEMGIWDSVHRRFVAPLSHELWPSRPIISRPDPYYPTDVVALLERETAAIRAEVLALERGFEPDMESLQSEGEDGEWTMARILHRNGTWNAAMCDRTPRTCQLVAGIPSVRECADARCSEIGVFFSRLLPETSIKPHCGPTMKRLRIHLPLVVPDECCSLRVADEAAVEWTEGSALVFDDSFEHEVRWNRGAQARIVLVVDVFHPEWLDRRRPSASAAGSKTRD